MSYLRCLGHTVGMRVVAAWCRGFGRMIYLRDALGACEWVIGLFCKRALEKRRYSYESYGAYEWVIAYVYCTSLLQLYVSFAQ